MGKRASATAVLSCCYVVLAMVCWLSAPPVHAGEVVTFQSKPIPPTPFKLRRAKAKGIELKPQPGVQLRAILSRPVADGPRPAVVVLVSGDGLQPSHLAWGEMLAEWGYVSLVIDSFGSRGATDFRDGGGADMVADADAAKSYLMGLDSVDPDNLALLGFSLGGSRLLTMFADRGSATGVEVRYKAGVAFYPNCDGEAAITRPVLLLAGDQDSLMSLPDCKRLAEKSAQGMATVALRVFRGATHFFDNPDYAKSSPNGKNGEDPLPLWYADNHYDEAAHRESLAEVRQFLAKHLK